MDELKIMKELEGLTDKQLYSVINAAQLQLDLRERTNNERFFELLQPLKKAVQDILSEFPQAHCYADNDCIYLEDLITDDTYWERQN